MHSNNKKNKNPFRFFANGFIRQIVANMFWKLFEAPTLGTFFGIHKTEWEAELDIKKIISDIAKDLLAVRSLNLIPKIHFKWEGETWYLLGNYFSCFLCCRCNEYLSMFVALIMQNTKRMMNKKYIAKKKMYVFIGSQTACAFSSLLRTFFYRSMFNVNEALTWFHQLAVSVSFLHLFSFHFPISCFLCSFLVLTYSEVSTKLLLLPPFFAFLFAVILGQIQSAV